jgi:hypothetical protein
METFEKEHESAGVKDIAGTASAVSQLALIPYQRCHRHRCCRISGVGDNAGDVNYI